MVDPSASPEFERPSHGRSHSVAPSLALPTALQSDEVDTTNWFTPPSPTSSIPHRRGESRPQTFIAISSNPLSNPRQPLITPASRQHDVESRAAVLRGSFDTSEEIDGERSGEGNDERLYGEEFFSRGYKAKGSHMGIHHDSGGSRFGSISITEGRDLAGLSKEQEEEDDDDDDVPLGVRHPSARGRIDEDDMPLAFNHLAANRPEDTDDHPLAYVHPAAAYAQHQHHSMQQQFYSHQQQQQQQQFYSQQAMMMQQFQMQQQMMAMQGGGEFGGDGGGNGDSVARWRQGIRSTSQQS